VASALTLSMALQPLTSTAGAAPPHVQKPPGTLLTREGIAHVQRTAGNRAATHLVEMHLRRPRTAAGANRTKRAEARADGQHGRAAGPPDILASRQAANSTAATLQRQKKG